MLYFYPHDYATTIIFKSNNYLSIFSALLGVSSLIFIAKGLAIGQWIMICFASLYGIISCIFQYYGEMITYVFMSLPIAVIALINWQKHPYKKSAVVEVGARVTKKQRIFMIFSAATITIVFYFILKAFNTAMLPVSTLSITASFIAAYLSACRSPFYALAYTVNDIVLIVLWVVAATKDTSCVPTVACFVMFLANDLYGFYNWNRIKRSQADGLTKELLEKEI